MAARPLLTLSLSLALLPLAGPSRALAVAVTMWTGWSGATVYAAPAPSALILARLPDNLPVRVTPEGSAWGRIRLWNAVPAWIPLAGLQPRPIVRPPLQIAPVALHPAGAHGAMSLSATGRTLVAVNVRATPTTLTQRRTTLARGAAVRVDAWATDGAGSAWYHIVAPARGWLWGAAVAFDAGRPADGSALLAPLRGKGMWFTYPLLTSSPVTAIIAAAQAAGLTHLYVEVGRSRDGFYGADGLASLLPAAHRAGISVIAWVYPFLDDLPFDVAMSVAAANYVAPSGDRPDGLLADVEEKLDDGTMRAYSQIMRAMLGPDRLMAVATFPPQSSPGKTYPYAIVARSWNVIVPMDYWHLHHRTYGAGEVYRFVRDSVRLIRARTTPDQPVEVLGQMFDVFESGVDSPSAAEVAACGRAARTTGALGVSFFEWNHATPEEWAALAGLPA
ncbi:MAG TPA: hypothetical protein VFE42_00965 [Chloroflexota bacterium]|nr:hypothetical protein [Chloroflexota bacterium]